jgi:hypothetical protein
MKSFAIIVVILFTTTSVAAEREDVKSISDVEQLRSDLARVSGIVKLNGIDTVDAMKKLSDAIISIDRRLAAMEAKK